MEEIGKILRIFFENHFIPAVFAMVLALITILNLPNDYWMIEKLGKNWFLALLFGVFFLVIILLLFLNQKLSSEMSKIKYRKKNREEEKNRIIQEWKNVFNHLDKEHLDIVKELVRNHNNQIEKPYHFQPSTQDFFIANDNRSTGFGGIEAGDFQNSIFICSTKYKDSEIQGEMKMVRLYKLQDSAYNVAKHLLETDGKLSVYDDFDKEE